MESHKHDIEGDGNWDPVNSVGPGMDVEGGKPPANMGH